MKEHYRIEKVFKCECQSLIHIMEWNYISLGPSDHDRIHICFGKCKMNWTNLKKGINLIRGGTGMANNLFADLFVDDGNGPATAVRKPKGSVKEVKNLERVIAHLDTKYEDGEPCEHPDTGDIVTDNEYDAMKARLAAIAPNSKIFNKVTASSATGATKKFVIDPPMTSIHKCNGTDTEKTKIFDAFVDNVRDELKGSFFAPPDKWLVCSLKHDGVAIHLEYEKGKLVRAGLRARDGVNADDVTENAKYVKGVPVTLKEPLTVKIRGELECLKSVFDKKNKELTDAGQEGYSNPRAYTAGSIRQFPDPKITSERGLSFTGYCILGLDKVPFKTAKERAEWAKKTLGIPFIDVYPFSWDLVRKMEDQHRKLDFLVDGVVVEVSDLESAEQLGTHGNSPTGDPKAKLAYKFADEKVNVTVTDIHWQTGRTGRITPVLDFKAVTIEGTQVSQCTAHNVGLVQKQKIGKGAEVTIIKSGKIIPKIVGVIKPASNVTFPSTCPSCGGPAKLIKGASDDMADLVCKNPKCKAQIVGNLCHYLSTFGVKGLAENVVGQLVDKGLVKTPADFYRLTTKDLENIGISYRTALLSVARVHMVPQPEKMKNNDALDVEVKAVIGKKKRIPLSQFIAALGITGASTGTGRALGSHFGDMDKIRKASVADMENVQDVGTKTAEGLVQYFKDSTAMLDDLLQYIEIDMPKTGPLSGKTFVFTGGFLGGKELWQKAVAENGGNVSSSVSKKTDILVVGDAPGSKLDKAKELQQSGYRIQIIKLDDLRKMLP